MLTHFENLIHKLEEIEAELAREKGPFMLFGLFLPEEGLDRWDLVLAAPWLELDGPNRDLIFRWLQERLSKEEIVLLSRVVTLEPGDAFVRAVERIRAHAGWFELP